MGCKLACMDSFPEARMIEAGGVRLAIYEAGAASSRPPVVLVHGWPEIAYSWREQMPALAEAGFRVIALDLKGFGRSDAPRDKALYDIHHMTDDLAALLDAMEIDRAVFCGHDWGGAMVWPMAQRHRARVAGVVSVCTPHLPPPPVPPLSIIEKRFGRSHYFIRFQEEGAAEAIFTGREDTFFRVMFRKPAKRADWEKLAPRIFDIPSRIEHGSTPAMTDVILSPEDLKVYVDAYKRSGFHGGVNLYRNIDVNYHLMKDVSIEISCPALMICAENDLFLPPETADGMEALVPDLEKHVIPDCGHWVTWERPEALNALLADWLTRRFAA